MGRVIKYMNDLLFEELLKKANLNKNSFSNKLGLNINYVRNWGKKYNYPSWVKKWLNEFIEKA